MEQNYMIIMTTAVITKAKFLLLLLNTVAFQGLTRIHTHPPTPPVTHPPTYPPPRTVRWF